MQSTKNVFPDIGFGRRLKAVRNERGMTLQQLASRVGCDRSYLSRLETGKAVNPSHNLIQAIAAVLAINEDWLRLGLGDPFSQPNVPDDFDIQFSSALSAIAEEMSPDQIIRCLGRIFENPSFPAPARSFWVALFAPWLDIKIQQKRATHGVELDKSKGKYNLPKVTRSEISSWQELHLLLRKALQSRGAKAALARTFGVTTQAVSQWVSNVSSPPADTALRLRKMLLDGSLTKPQLKKSAGSSAERPTTKTRKGKIKRNEKTKSDQKES